MMRVAAAIIAGGQGTRMGGREKGLLRVDGRRIVDRQLDVLRPIFDSVFIVSNDPAPWASLGVSTVPDKRSGRLGPLAGVEAALESLSPPIDAVVCVAADMPFLDPQALRLLRDYPPDEDAVVPLVDGRPEPLFARYHRRCMAAARTQLERGDNKLIDLFERVSVAWIEEADLRAIDRHLRFLINVNTPEELAALSKDET